MLLSLLLAATAPSPPPPGAPSRTYLQNFKDQILSSCIAQAYASSPDATKDASASAGGYLEFNSFDIEHGGDAARALIDRTLARTYGSFQGPSVRLDLMKCIDLYHSAELERMGRRYSRTPDRRWSQDNKE